MSDSTMISALFAGIGELFLILILKKHEENQYWIFCPKWTLTPKNPPPKSRFSKKIFDNFVFLISSRAQTGAVHINSTRRIFLNRSQGFLTSFLGVKAD